MYTPPAFRLEDPALVDLVAAAAPFAILVAADPDGTPQIAHLPLLAVRDGDSLTVRGHVARANPMAALIEAGSTATAVFTGPNAYVTPDWYDGPDQVPTWNYLAVHATGRLRPVSDPAAVTAMLADLSGAHEAGLAPKAPWTIDKMDPGKLGRMLKGITAFDLPVERLEGKAKLSQNKAPGDRERVMQAMRALQRPAPSAVADWMARLSG